MQGPFFLNVFVTPTVKYIQQINSQLNCTVVSSSFKTHIFQSQQELKVGT